MTAFRLAVLALVAATTASPATEPDPATEKAVLAYQERGGRVVRADTVPGKPVTIVDLHRIAVTDADLAPLAGMTDLEVLDLSYTKVTDAGLKHVAKLTKLKQLSVYGTKVSDAGLVHLKGVTSLETLFLAETVIGDKGLEHLTGLGSLQAVELDQTQVTDAGLMSLGKLTKLRRRCRLPAATWRGRRTTWRPRSSAESSTASPARTPRTHALPHAHVQRAPKRCTACTEHRAPCSTRSHESEHRERLSQRRC